MIEVFQGSRELSSKKKVMERPTHFLWACLRQNLQHKDRVRGTYEIDIPYIQPPPHSMPNNLRLAVASTAEGILFCFFVKE